MTSCRIFLFLLFLAVIQIEAKRYTDSSEYDEWQEFKEFQRWKHSRKHHDRGHFNRKSKYHGLQEPYEIEEPDTHDEEQSGEGPPPIDQAAQMARYIVNQNNWTSVATISAIPDVKSFPFVNVVSYSDGPLSNGTGMPYLYITPLDYTAQDLAKDPRATLSMTLAAGEYCATQSYDPMDPRCARVYITGIIKTVKNNTAEFEIAKNAVFGRHPWLAHMPPNHHFFFVKVKIIQIALLDTFGGPKYITPKDYFAANQRPAQPSFREDKIADIYDDDSIDLRRHPKISIV